MQIAGQDRSRYRTPHIGICAGIALFTGIVGIWLPLISISVGAGPWINVPWGLAYNGVAGCLLDLLGESTPGSAHAVFQMLIGFLIWPLITCGMVCFAAMKLSEAGTNGRRIGVSLLVASLFIVMPEDAIGSGHQAAYLISMGFLY